MHRSTPRPTLLRRALPGALALAGRALPLADGGDAGAAGVWARVGPTRVVRVARDSAESRSSVGVVMCVSVGCSYCTPLKVAREPSPMPCRRE